MGRASPTGAGDEGERRHRLTPWERYMALDYGPRHSMTCFSRFWLSRPVCRDAFIAAVTAVAADNPFLAVARQGPNWVPVRFAASEQIDWAESPAAVDWSHLQPDDTLVRWTARIGRLGDLGVAEPELDDVTGTLVLMRYPHAVADGLGAAAAMRQLCDRLAGRPATVAVARDPDVRTTLGNTPRARRIRTRHELGRIARFFRKFPAAFAPAAARAASPGRHAPVFERLTLSSATTNRLRTAARAVGVTVNDVLLAALFRTLAPHMGSRHSIRIAVPTSLRARDNLAFCNQVSMVFLDRTAARVGDPALLRGVAAETGHVKRWRLGHAMHSFLAAGFLPGDGPLSLIMRLPLVPATAVLSNLGDPFADADASAESVRVVAHDLMSPLRPGTNLAVGVARHDGRLALTLRFAPDRIPRPLARRLLERIPVEADAVLSEAGSRADAPAS